MRFVFMAALVVGFACSSKDADRMRDVAARVNPVIVSLRSPASIVLDPDKRSDISTLTAACIQGVELARPLAAIDFKDEYVGNDRRLGIDDVMFMFSHDAPTYCPQAHRDADCADWCVKRYDELADAIDRLREQAAKKGVQIQSLRK